jgi:hypothetical protein
MYVVIYVNKNKIMLASMREALKEQYQSIQYNLREATPGEFSIRLEGVASEVESVAFCKGFAAAWSANIETVMAEVK